MKYKVLSLVGLIVIVLIAATATAQNLRVSENVKDKVIENETDKGKVNVTEGKVRAVTSAMNFRICGSWNRDGRFA